MPHTTPQNASERNASQDFRKHADVHTLAKRETIGAAQDQAPTITPEALAEFQQLYLQEYGVKISLEEARLKAQPLIELFRILLRPPR